MQRIAKSLILIVLSFSVSANSDIQTLLKENFELHQMWALSRNYYHGTTLKKDLVKALAWQMVYTSVLPPSYPGRNTLIERYKKGLSEAEVSLAHEYAKTLKETYHLDFHLSEADLYSIFVSKNEANQVSPHPVSAFKTKQQFLNEVKKSDAKLAKHYETVFNDIQLEEGKSVVYGKITINGVEPAEMVQASQSIRISPDGYFIANVRSPLTFKLVGYQDINKTFSADKQLINLGQLNLVKPGKKQLANLVGQITPKEIAPDIDIQLQLADIFKRDEPWLTPVIPVTVLPGGEFYVKDLAPNHYDLVVNYQGKITKEPLTIKSGSFKRVRPINPLKD